MTSSLLSIVIPTWNRCSLLAELLHSLATQSCAGVEIIVCDNASTDSTFSVVEEASRVFLIPIKYHRHATNIGGNSNIGFSAGVGCGAYIWVLGDDEVVPFGSLERIVKLLHAGPDYLLLNHAIFDSSMKNVRIARWHSLREDKILSGRSDGMSFLGPSPSFISAVIARRGILDSLSGEELSTYSSYGFNQLLAFYKGLSLQGWGIATSAILVHARGDNSAGLYDWNKFFVQGLSLVFDRLTSVYGYDRGAVVKAKGKVVTRYHIMRLLNEKAEGRDCERLTKLVREHFYECWQFKVLFWPLSLTPDLLWRWVKYFKKRLGALRTAAI